MVLAAATGKVDFVAADFRDRAWWLRTRWQLDQLEDERLQKVLELQHTQNLAVLSGGAVEQSFEHHWKHANQNITSLHELMFPWLSGSAEKNRMSEIAQLRQQWVNKYGDPRDPKVKAKLDKIVKSLRDKEAKAESRNFSDSKKLSRMLKQVNKTRKHKRNG